MYFSISIQVQIVLAICLFYLYDAALLLKPEEGLLRPKRRGWTGMLANQGFELRQNWLLWPPILLPHQPLYKLHWDTTRIELSENAPLSTPLDTHAASFKVFALPLYLLAALLFIALPLSLLVLHSELAQLASLGLIYLCTAGLGLLTLRHGRLGHSPRALARSTAMQILLCPPFALNVVRKLSLAHAAQGDLLQNALALMSPPQWQHFSEQVQTTMQREMQEIAELPEYAVHLTRMQAALKNLQQYSSPLEAQAAEA